ncbi:hypothetical protein JCM6882_001727 [Rhodosporidiobolus microsporus]
MTSTSPPHSPSSPTAHQPYQQLADADHCFPPSSSSASITPGRARSGSRTFSVVQEDERRERHRERESSVERDRRRAEAENALEGRISDEALRNQLNQPDEGMSMTELRAEMETLLSLRRRSMSQPATVDPDLPPTAPPTSAPPPSASKRPQLTLTITPPTEGPGGAPISPTAPSPAETGTLVRRRSSVSGRLPSEHPLPIPPVPSPPNNPHVAHSPFAPSDSAQSAQDLFWLPASLHPELAPQEFKAFIREQTRPEALARRSSLSLGAPGTGGRGVGRRVSLLRGEYKPKKDDGVGEEKEPTQTGADGVKRTASDGGAGRGSRNRRSTLNFEELTIKDLQRLEELAAKAEAEGAGADADEGERLGRVLRRSLSLNPHRVAAAAAAAGATFGGQPLGPETIEEEALSSEEAPIIVPPPGQILRRNARTKIRKGSTGEWVGGGRVGGPAGGSRFGSRRTRSSTSETGVGLGSTLSSTEDDAMSAGDVSFESMESEEVRAAGGMMAGEGLAPVVLTDEGAVVGPSPSPSPPSSDSQHVEVPQHQAIPHEEVVAPQEAPLPPIPHPQVEQPYVEEPTAHAPEPAPSLGLPPVGAPIEVQHQPHQPEPPQPELPSRHAISPASAEYDWSTHNLQYQQPQPQAPPPPSEPQYTVHPGHSSRQSFSDVPPPQAVPVPLPERKESPSPPPSRPESPKPSGKEKKSGWSRLLGKDDDKKKKGKGKEKDTSAGGEAEKESSSSSGFFGGLFGRKKSDTDHPPPPVLTPVVAPEARLPPPPPTASGALLPNGRYANFYRLPIHVERAVYRLSHIKLANPRRPLYEQVLISNLMFWYLGLIQKPVQPPPAAQPVPIPGMRNQQAPPSNASSSPPHDAAQGDAGRSATSPPQQKRTGLNKPGRGGRTAETPMRTPSYEVQNQQLAEEQQQHYRQQQHQQLSQSHPQPSHSITKTLFAAPLSSSSNPGDPKSRSPDRTSAPAQLYPSRTPSNSVEGGEDDDDDDRPLAQYGSQPAPQQAPYRESYPQSNRPTPVAAYPSHEPGFQVTSRTRRVSGGGGSSEGHGSGSGHLSASFDPQSASPVPSHQRRPSAVSDKSFDAGEIYEAYAPAPDSPSALSHASMELAPPPKSPPRAPSPTLQPLQPHQQPPSPDLAAGGGGAGKPPLLGTVAPRGSSLKALMGEKGKKAAAAVGVGGGVRSR